MTQPPVQTAIDEYVFLIGRPPIGELLNFIRTMSVNGQNTDEGALTRRWRAANDHVVELERTEPGIADNPPIRDLPENLKPLAQELLASPIAQRAFRFLPTSIQVVELDKLVVFQKYINLAYINQLKARMGKGPSEEEVFRLCLPVTPPQPAVRVMQNAPNSFTFISSSNDFRFLEAAYLKPQQVTGFVSTGRPTAFIGLAIGFGSNFLNVIDAENRLILNNGSHRAYALRDLGVTHAPCLVQHVSRRDELELVASGDVQQSPDRYLKSPRPPLLRDYFDEQLRMVVPVPRKNRVVRLQFGFEQAEIPAS